jgi:hypothetical protein
LVNGYARLLGIFDGLPVIRGLESVSGEVVHGDSGPEHRRGYGIKMERPCLELGIFFRLNRRSRVVLSRNILNRVDVALEKPIERQFVDVILLDSDLANVMWVVVRQPPQRVGHALSSNSEVSSHAAVVRPSDGHDRCLSAWQFGG